jgi:hypothetical protein
MNLNYLLSQVGLSQKTGQDVVLVLFVALVGFIYGMLIGRSKIMTVLVNIYVAFAIITVIPKELVIDPMTKVFIFLGMIIALTFLSRKFFDLSFSGAGPSFLWRIFSMSFLQVAMVLSVILAIIPKKDALVYVSTSAYGYLTLGWAPLVWMALPLAYMLFLYRKSY